jgi:hypothetical protein
MLLLVHLDHLFMGSEDPLTGGQLKGHRYPDGHVYVYSGTKTLQDLQRIYSLQRGDEFTALMRQYPEGRIVVDCTTQRMKYSGLRRPSALSIDTEVMWFDFDTRNNVGRIYRITRRAFETQRELAKRIIADSEIIQEISFDDAPNHVITSVDSGGMLCWPLHLDETLYA